MSEILLDDSDLESATLLKSKRSGGPKTDEGKARSSENSTSHGLCSKRLILPGESSEEFETLQQGWRTDYESGIFIPQPLLSNVIEAHWLLLRNQNRCNDFEFSLAEKSPADWTDQDHRNLTNFTRYRTAADRSFHRCLTDLEKYRSTRLREQFSEERIELRKIEISTKIIRKASAKQEDLEQSTKQAQREADKAQKQAEDAAKATAQQAKKDEEAAAKFVKDRLTIEWTKGRQWVEIHTHVETGEFTIEYFPQNETLIDEFRHKDKPEMLYRYLHFMNGVPDEFAFTMPPDAQYKKLGGLVLHRMEWHVWLKQIVFEKETRNGLPGPIQGRTYHRWETWRDNQKDRIAQGLPFKDWKAPEK